MEGWVESVKPWFHTYVRWSPTSMSPLTNLFIQVPMVLLPKTIEQQMNARRIEVYHQRGQFLIQY